MGKPHNDKGFSDVVLGRKFCTSCRIWRHIFDFYVAERWDDGTPRRFQGACRTCQRVDQRRRVGLRRRGEPYGKKKPAMDRETRNARKRELYHAMTPEQKRLRREYNRIYAEVRRRSRGVPQRNFVNRRTVVDEEGYELVPVGPISDWMRRNYGLNGGMMRLSVEIGIDDAKLAKILHRRVSRVKLETVDKILVFSSRGGNPALLPDLYPGLYQ